MTILRSPASYSHQTSISARISFQFGRVGAFVLPRRGRNPMKWDCTTTNWSQVLAARDGSTTQSQKALEALSQTY